MVLVTYNKCFSVRALSHCSPLSVCVRASECNAINVLSTSTVPVNSGKLNSLISIVRIFVAVLFWRKERKRTTKLTCQPSFLCVQNTFDYRRAQHSLSLRMNSSVGIATGSIYVSSMRVDILRRSAQFEHILQSVLLSSSVFAFVDFVYVLSITLGTNVLRSIFLHHFVLRSMCIYFYFCVSFSKENHNNWRRFYSIFTIHVRLCSSHLVVVVVVFLRRVFRFFILLFWILFFIILSVFLLLLRLHELWWSKQKIRNIINSRLWIEWEACSIVSSDVLRMAAAAAIATIVVAFYLLLFASRILPWNKYSMRIIHVYSA